MTRLRQLLTQHAVSRGSFVLASGRMSPYYLDTRLVTLRAEGAWLTGRAVLEAVRDLTIEAIGGPSLAADPIVSATITASYAAGRPLKGFLVRGQAKGHGHQRQIEGPLEPCMGVVVVDDILTTGTSLLNAIAAVEAFGCVVIRVVVLIDRLDGGAEAIRDAGYDFRAIYTIRDLGISAGRV